MAQSLHDGHRKRLKDRFLKHGLDAFENHEILEFLLFYALARKDTNEIAHRLLKEFGSLPAVLEADHDALCRVEGISAHSASLIRLCNQLFARYEAEKMTSVRTFSDIDHVANYLKPFFVGEATEKAMVVCTNNRFELLGCDVLSTGTVTTTEARTREIVECALRRKATGIILAHNHPSGFASPSPEDVQITGRLVQNLRAMEIAVIDHLIFSGSGYMSLRKSPQFAPLFSSFNR